MKPPVFQDRGTAAFEDEVISYESEAMVRKELKGSWGPRVLYAPLLQREDERYSDGSAPAFFSPPTELKKESEPPERWRFGLGKSFRKAVNAIDRKLQGRILEAITDIAAAPLTNRGDTVKPLSGEMNGYWRYRIGDFRLVYYPDEATRTITLCDCASRRSAYD